MGSVNKKASLEDVVRILQDIKTNFSSEMLDEFITGFKEGMDQQIKEISELKKTFKSSKVASQYSEREINDVLDKLDSLSDVNKKNIVTAIEPVLLKEQSAKISKDTTAIPSSNSYSEIDITLNEIKDALKSSNLYDDFNLKSFISNSNKNSAEIFKILNTFSEYNSDLGEDSIMNDVNDIITNGRSNYGTNDAKNIGLNLFDNIISDLQSYRLKLNDDVNKNDNMLLEKLADLMNVKINVVNGETVGSKLNDQGVSEPIAGKELIKIINKLNKTVQDFNLLGDIAYSNSAGSDKDSKAIKLNIAKTLYKSKSEEQGTFDGTIPNEFELLSFIEKEEKAAKSRLKNISEEQILILGMNAAERQRLTLMQLQASVAENRMEILKEYDSKIKAVEGLSNNVLSEVSNILNDIPDSLKSILGVSEIEETLGTAFTAANAKFKEALISTNGNMTAALTEYSNTLSTLLTTAINPVTLILAGVAVLGVTLYNVLGDIKEISTELGVSRKQASELHDVILDMEGAAGNFAVTQEKILSIQKESIAINGRMLDMHDQANKELVEYAALMETAYGVAAGEGYKMVDIFQRLGADESVANNLAAGVLEASTLAKISPTIIAKDLIDNADLLATYFAGMPEDAARAVVEIRKMGSSIDKVGQLIEKTWNVESFMTDMFELAAMSGGAIDLTPVFDMGIKRDVIGTQQALLDAIGSLDTFNNSFSDLERKKLAATVGMEVGDIANMLSLNEKNLQLTAEENAALQSRLDTMGDITGMSKQDLEARAKEYAATDALGMAWTKIKATLTKAILPFVETFGVILSGISPILDLIGLGFKVIGLMIKPFIPALRLVGDILGFIMGVVTDITKIFDKLLKNFDGIGLGSENMQKFLSVGLVGLMTLTGSWGKFFKILSKGFTLPLKLAGNLVNLLLKPMGMKLPTLFNAGKAALPETAGAGKSIFSKAKDFIAGKISTPGKTIADIVTDSGTKPISNTITETISEKVNPKSMKDTFSKLGDNVKSGMTSLKNNILDGLTGLKNIILKIVDVIAEPLKKVASTAGDMIKSILGGIADGMNKFSPKALIGAAAMLVMSGAIWVLSKAIKGFEEVSGGAVAKLLASLLGLTVISKLLSKATPEMILGAIGIGLLGAALIPMAYALKMFEGISWESLGKAAAAIIGLGLAGAAFGALLPLMLAGAVAIGALGVSLMLFGGALFVIGSGVEKLANAAAVVVNSMTQLSAVEPERLVGIGSGLMAIAAGLTMLTLASGQGLFVNLLAGDPLKKILKLADAAPGINLVASSIESLSTHIKELVELTPKLDTDKLNKLGNINIKSPEITGVSSSLKSQSIASTSIKNTETDINNINSTFKTNSMQMQLPEVERLIREILNVINNYGNRPNSVVITPAAIGEIAKQVKTYNNR